MGPSRASGGAWKGSHLSCICSVRSLGYWDVLIYVSSYLFHCVLQVLSNGFKIGIYTVYFKECIWSETSFCRLMLARRAAARVDRLFSRCWDPIILVIHEVEGLIRYGLINFIGIFLLIHGVFLAIFDEPISIMPPIVSKPPGAYFLHNIRIKIFPCLPDHFIWFCPWSFSRSFYHRVILMCFNIAFWLRIPIFHQCYIYLGSLFCTQRCSSVSSTNSLSIFCCDVCCARLWSINSRNI